MRWNLAVSSGDSERVRLRGEGDLPLGWGNGRRSVPSLAKAAPWSCPPPPPPPCCLSCAHLSPTLFPPLLLSSLGEGDRFEPLPLPCLGGVSLRREERGGVSPRGGAGPSSWRARTLRSSRGGVRLSLRPLVRAEGGGAGEMVPEPRRREEPIGSEGETA